MAVNGDPMPARPTTNAASMTRRHRRWPGKSGRATFLPARQESAVASNLNSNH